MRHGWLKHLPDLLTPYRASTKVTRRAWFSPEEYKTLYETTRKRAQEAKGKPYQWAAEQMHDYVLFVANTGIRPDEANRLEFRDVNIVKDDSIDQTIPEIEVRGKRGVGYCKSRFKRRDMWIRLLRWCCARRLNQHNRPIPDMASAPIFGCLEDQRRWGLEVPN